MPDSHRETQPSEPDPEHAASALVIRQMRRLRIERGWSAQELADRCDIQAAPAQNSLGRGRISKLESGVFASLRVDELVVLARAFGVSPTAFLPDTIWMSTDEMTSSPLPMNQRLENVETKVDTIYRALGAAGIIELPDSET